MHCIYTCSGCARPIGARMHCIYTCSGCARPIGARMYWKYEDLKYASRMLYFLYSIKIPDLMLALYARAYMCVSCALAHCLQVIVVLPSNRKDRYDSIKKFCCIDRPVPSQCILQRTLSKKQNLMSVTTKVAMQLCCKLGGELWALEVPVSGSRVVEPRLSHLMFAHWVC